MFVRLLSSRRGPRPATTCRRSQVCVPRRRPVPRRRQAADDRVVRPGDPRVLRRYRGRVRRAATADRVARPPGHGGPAPTAWPDPRFDEDHRTRLPAGRVGARSTSRRGPTAASNTTTAPEKTRRRHRDGLRHARRRRLSSTRTGSSTSPTASLHDHLGRREHLPAGDRERATVDPSQVVDVAVIGVPNDDLGEEVKAVVQPVEMPADTEEADALAKELIAFCRSQLADVKCPRSIDFRPESSPATPLGSSTSGTSKTSTGPRQVGRSDIGRRGQRPGHFEVLVALEPVPELGRPRRHRRTDRRAVGIEQQTGEPFGGHDTTVRRLTALGPSPTVAVAHNIAVWSGAGTGVMRQVPPPRVVSASARIPASSSAAEMARSCPATTRSRARTSGTRPVTERPR